MRGVRVLSCAVVLAAVAVGCSGSSEGDGRSGGGTGGKGPGGQDQPPERLKKFSVPGEYDSTQGWQQTIHGLPENPSAIPGTLAVKSKSLAYLLTGPNGYVLQSRTLDSGRLRWASKKWNPPTPTWNADGDADLGKEAEVPDVTTVTEDGREYIVAWAHGLKGKDELHDGKEVVQLSVFPADASSEAVAPDRTVTVPAEVGLSDELEVRDGGHGVLVTWGEQAAAVNIRTGKVKQYKDANGLLEQCDGMCFDSKVKALTGAGPVVGTEEGFGVPGRWFNEDHAPKGTESGELLAAADEHLLASWETEDDSGFGDSDAVFAVHDPETGAIEARTTCSEDGYSDGKNMWGEGSAPPPSTSPNGRYLVAGSVAFDLKKKRGICLAGDGDRKKIILASVRDDGTAYGGTDAEDSDEGQSTGVAVSVASGRPKALADGTEVPVDVSPKAGVFLTRGKNDEPGVAIVHER
ncbi:hypothetical protein ACTWQF_36040 [Streptomyces sp. 8N114]|uniref:hypothetical protein n=1 Tax=Streptomyces sp. 8N114 TaxID=3457419 RepID=UPI003FD5F8F5